ncbi:MULTISPECIES: hypothetical protein [Massilia]|uniref:Uncharacterized protein n=1 Tax=Massilia haematophila TaxID=457923 RepID=A0ABV7PG53_9BURK|nr:hypothetical protein [Massilia sp.]
MLAILEQQKNQTDPQKLKALKEEEENEMSRHQDAVAGVCRKICSGNPDN